ncbi:membrane-associated phospholipid phosphatase [Arthrobacter ulcerisalmonis]|uniref:phosphatase PAP2 family protein n=1 Tax=Arthrobacter sp. B1I2 TaxID=3042263 RepID=UPI0027858BBF|nr:MULTISPECIES: phosphatase PAP2 family protein [Arthrobacter]MDQ0662920.1 membrane-associated phospholipid phosphatase [Arthrobacter ulcerisalmonis]MDQ0730812.1 membrane-associated phospholipid phosphatase [Arthrobacter sp. B1I2]
MVQKSAGSAATKKSNGRWHTFHEKFVVEERYVDPDDRRGLYRASAILAVAGLALFIATLVSVVQADGLSAADTPVHDWLLTTRSGAVTAIMIFLAVFFGPIALPIIVLVVILVWGFAAKHAWRPILLASAMLTGVIVSQIILHIVQRSRPPVDQMLFGADQTFSFPSGHVLGACDFLLVGAYLIFSRRRNPRAAVFGFIGAGIGIILAIVSRLYLGYHWTTDALASFSLSLLILGGVIALDTWRTARIPGEPVTGELSKAEFPPE